ncbi:helix-turn-helix domain-containing protein [Nocardia rhizosphaerihabitans]|uniref:helix-turn-helix domain-containing protein n=1 Tax=Nocardia rhizosphaerihabitans TaxID=1691570 RepID=UPI0036700B79
MATFVIPDGWVAQAYRFALDPTPAQARALASHAGAARFAHNHMLALVKAVLDQRAAERSYDLTADELTPLLGWSLAALRKTWNTRKGEHAPWWSENSKEAYNTGLDGLARALDNWSKSRTGLGTIRTHESTRKLARRIDSGSARVLSATATQDAAGRWYCSFQTIVAAKTRLEHAARSRHPVVGVDVGVKNLLVVAAPDGTEITRVRAPKPLARAQKRLRSLQRTSARQHGRYNPVTRTKQQPSRR